MPSTWIAIAVIALVLGGAIFHIIREKRKGVACVGCPAARNCAAARECAARRKGSACGVQEDQGDRA